MSYFNWNLVTTAAPTPTYYTYIIQPALYPVTVGVPNPQLPILQQQIPTLQQQVPTLQQTQFLHQNDQLPVNIVQQVPVSVTNRSLKNAPRSIAPKPTLGRFEEQVIEVKEEDGGEDESSGSIVKEEPDETKLKVEDVPLKDEGETDENYDKVVIKEEKEDTDCDDVETEEVETVEDDKSKKKRQKRVKTSTDGEKAKRRKPLTPLKCEHCPYTTTWKGNLTKHIISKHTSLDEINWLQCDHCPYKGKTRDYLKCHLLHVHDIKVKWFDCPHCDFRAKMKCLLDRHTIINHPESTEINWLKCEQCSYRAKFKNNLKEHMLSKHTQSNDIRWFHCAHCKFKSKRKRNLKFHILNKHTSDDRIQWFQCEICPYRMFKRRSALRKHVAIVHKEQDKELHDVNDETGKGNVEMKSEVEDDLQIKPETKEIPVFIDNRLCWKRVVVKADNDHSHKCPQCTFHTDDKDVFKKHILKYHVVTELKEEDDGIVKTSYKTRDVVVMVDDVPCIKRIVDHPV